MAKKVLICSASVGGGHVRAAEAIGLALKELAPDTMVKNIDVLEYAWWSFRWLYKRGYFGLVNSAPALYAALYDYMDRPRRHDPSWSDGVRKWWERLNMGRYFKLLHGEQWDFIVHTHYLSAEVLCWPRHKGKIKIPQCVVTTDFDTHRLWAAEPTEHYFTGNEDAGLYLQSFGVSADKISVTGVPIHPVFSSLLDRKACLASQGLTGDRPVILQLAGGFGLGPIEGIFHALLTVETPIELVVVAGHNEAAKKKLEAIEVPERHKVRIIGFTTKIHELMAVADLVVSKPGGLTTSEALACGAAMAIVNPIPGQEVRNADYLLENGAAVKVNNTFTLARKVGALLADRSRLEALKQNAKRLGRPKAAYDIARYVLDYPARA